MNRTGASRSIDATASLLRERDRPGERQRAIDAGDLALDAPRLGVGETRECPTTPTRRVVLPLGADLRRRTVSRNHGCRRAQRDREPAVLRPDGGAECLEIGLRDYLEGPGDGAADSGAGLRSGWIRLNGHG